MEQTALLTDWRLTSSQTQMLSLAETATELGITADVLLAWETRYGHPRSHHALTDEEPMYARAEVLALSEALQCVLSIASAMSRIPPHGDGKPSRKLEQEQLDEAAGHDQPDHRLGRTAHTG